MKPRCLMGRSKDAQVRYFSVLKCYICEVAQCSVIVWKSEKVLKMPLYGYGLKKEHIYFVKLEL